MRKPFMGAIVALAAVLAFSAVAKAQMPQAQAKAKKAPGVWDYDPLDDDGTTGGPAPKRSLTGTWNGPGSSPAVKRGAPAEKPELTPQGQQIMDKRKTIGKYGPGGSNDPFVRYCDPFGFPRQLFQEGRALSVSEMPNRIVFLVQYGSVWREVWLDGRPLPTNVDVPAKDSLNSSYNGYSTAHWEDDYNLVIETTGMTEDTWLTGNGLPHSINAKVTERWTRIDHNDMKVTVTVDDPAMYKKPFSMGENYYRWVPNQKINEWICVPSEVQKYLREQADPAGSTENESPQSLGSGRRGQ
jgi:hypothetical protein